MNIAVIGGGISGLTAAHLLSEQHSVTLFEANDYVGGHTATKDVELGGQSYAVDTGFIVFNDWTYPNFIKLMAKLGIDSQPSSMGFSVTTVDQSLEYCGSGLNAMFSDRKNLFNPKFLGMIRDILRFNKTAKNDLDNDRIPAGLSLLDYVRQENFGELFLRGYIFPMASAIWSSSARTVEQFDALFFIRFFKNHGLLNINDRPQWRVVKGGSRSYVPAITQSFKDRIHTATPVRKIKRDDEGVFIKTDQADHRFDKVVIAAHSDQALAMLEDPDDSESDVLSSIPYSENSVILHTDTGVLPRQKRAWSSWNYLIDGQEREAPVLTYNMNILQSLDSPDTLCVTVNGDRHIAEEKVINRFTYAHPQFSVEGMRAQKEWSSINGKRNTCYCGAYWANGFHEDGVLSGIRAAESLGAKWTL